MSALYALMSVLLLATPSAPAKASEASVNTASDDDCEVSLKPIDLGQLMNGAFADKAGQWAEYASVKDGKPDTTSTIRFSIIQDPETQKAGIELWFDKLGDMAVRSKFSANGEIIQELKQGDRAFLVPASEEKEEKKSKEVCQIEKIIKKEFQTAVEENKKPIHLKTLAGEFDCHEVKLKSPLGEITIYVSDKAPLLQIIRLVMKQNTLELVAHGDKAYSAFSPDLMTIPLSKLTEVMEQFQADAQKKPDQSIPPAETMPANVPAPVAPAIAPVPTSSKGTDAAQP
ncbi:MAG: hypothetical protein LBM75_04245 [Myxococcales bacterium]|jgi:hypothetical protein|nr:hypothetical protein [Myxococcales bacterium]